MPKTQPTIQKRLRAGIYARVSDPATQDRAEDVSVDTQLDDCRQLAAEQGLTVVREYVDRKRYRSRTGQIVDPSGERTDRPAWRDLLADMEQGALDVVIAWKEDRLLRGVRAAVVFGDALENSRVKVELVKDKFDPKMLYIKAAIGKMELDAIRERTAMGRTGRVKKRGLTATRTSPYYDPIRDTATGKTTHYEFNQRYRRAFDNMATLFIERYSYREIAKRLSINPRTNKRWRAENIRQIFLNPFYRGQIEHGRRARLPNTERFTVKGAHAPAWDEATCAAIETELARRSALGNHNPRSQKAPFAGLLRCGYCGCLMSPGGSSRRRKNGEPFRYYDCYINRQVIHGYQDGVPHPPNSVSQLNLLKWVQAALGNMPTDKLDALLTAASTVFAAAITPASEDPAHSEKQIKLLEQQIAELRAENETVRSPVARQALAVEIARLEELADEFRTETKTQPTHGRFLPNPKTVRENFLKLTQMPDLLNQPESALRPLIQGAIPQLYVRRGEISLIPFSETPK